ncbi:hypothetical protein M758_10G118200 [Ceratodon purpureus]|uniref:Uncharacterized protein n=1 Tax=Ceratodon purpureus TaxID=3225 RepID=A0A8T0GM76_CERPU|nr:hypothetical protein KC19_10G122700 [Ceratodon purpureus]KAG0603753.1 hypothetical protein M758_10G118200 [Ceratodon purpureus]
MWKLENWGKHIKMYNLATLILECFSNPQSPYEHIKGNVCKLRKSLSVILCMQGLTPILYPMCICAVLPGSVATQCKWSSNVCKVASEIYKPGSQNTQRHCLIFILDIPDVFGK